MQLVALSSREQWCKKGYGYFGSGYANNDQHLRRYSNWSRWPSLLIKSQKSRSYDGEATGILGSPKHQHIVIIIGYYLTNKCKGDGLVVIY